MSFRQDTPKIELLQLMWRSTNPKDQEAFINHENDENDNSPDELSITLYNLNMRFHPSDGSDPTSRTISVAMVPISTWDESVNKVTTVILNMMHPTIRRKRINGYGYYFVMCWRL